MGTLHDTMTVTERVVLMALLENYLDGVARKTGKPTPTPEEFLRRLEGIAQTAAQEGR